MTAEKGVLLPKKIRPGARAERAGGGLGSKNVGVPC